jgi:hypothetical protein
MTGAGKALRICIPSHSPFVRTERPAKALKIENYVRFNWIRATIQRRNFVRNLQVP